MPVWWGTFAYMMVVSFIGMYMYKSKKQSATLVPVEGEKTENYKSIGLVMALLSFALLVFFAGNRSIIHDTQEYQYMYDLFYTDDLNQIPDIISGNTKVVKGPLFFIYLVIFKHFTHGTYTDWFLSVALIQCVSIALFFYKYSVNYVYSVFLFYMTSGVIWLVNGMRQFLAVAIVLFFADLFFKRKTIPFIIVVIVVYFIHSASLLWIPVYFIINFKPWSSKFFVCVVAFVIGMILFSRSSFLSETDFSYLQEDENAGINLFRILVNFVPSILAFIKRKETEELNSPFIDILINLSVITSACYLIGYFSNGVVARIAEYFVLFNYVLMPLLFKKVYDESLSKTIMLVSLVGYFAYFCFEMYNAKNGIYISDSLGIAYWTP